ncbi:M48 metallopeptidase family protein [Calderihabitans maritimus]|uniref:Hydrolase n=1 Tax=Calderihabitans maritimus TaxID=1246530 RepID=A0A1Z5HTB5_9FIRM|nr:M48 family metallopeptidase [Calderihabitans maritimus]GAW92769.1 hydrolase [Calderihabitans maritimus]
MSVEYLHESEKIPSNVSLEEAIPAAVFKAEVQTWAKRIGVEPREIHLRPMKRKWGSCSSSGRLTFNTELLTKPAAFRAEIIVHELLHLKIPNHGRLFRAVLKSYLAKWGIASA